MEDFCLLALLSFFSNYARNDTYVRMNALFLRAGFPPGYLNDILMGFVLPRTLLTLHH